ncbi:acyltransferase [Maioricimonas sp. JC845]|uniref:acyltransferase family protein n=1 Tax=Maioricimonas sp. JC845 TaxID=3232138 RepID=UPI00345815FC
MARRLANLFPPPRPFDPAPSRHCPPLDGVRGLAILIVFAYDCLKIPNDGNPISLGVRWLSTAGWSGVDLFFVLSGFLITGILLDTRGRDGYLSSFYLRRAVRILPLYYVTLFVVFGIMPPVLEALHASASVQQSYAQLSADQLWFWCYLQNWMVALRQAWPDNNVLNHFWSLAVEEQFYLVWPFVVMWLSRRQLAWTCLTACLFALAARIGLLWWGVAPLTTYVSTLTRLDSLCAGALLAIGIRNARIYPWIARAALPVTVGMAVAVAALDAVWPVLRYETTGMHMVGHTLLAILFAGLIGTAATVRPDHVLARSLTIRPLTKLGLYSYAIYVLHRPVYRMVQSFDWSWLLPTVRGYTVFGVSLALSVLAAAVSWIVLERPMLSLKRYFPRPGEESATGDEVDRQPAGAAEPEGMAVARS